MKFFQFVIFIIYIAQQCVKINGLKFLDHIAYIDFTSTKLTCMKFSVDGNQLVIGTNEELLYIYDTQNEFQKQTKYVEGGAYEMSFSPNGQYLVVESGNQGEKYLQILDTQDGYKKLKETNREENTSQSVGSIDFSQDGKYMVYFQEHKETSDLLIYDENFELQYHILEYPVTHGVVSFSLDGKYMIWAGYQKGIQFYDVENEFETIKKYNNKEVFYISVSYSSKYIYCGGRNGISIYSYDRYLDSLGVFESLNDYYSSYTAYQVDPILITGYESGKIRAFDINNNYKLIQQIHQDNESITQILFSPDSKYMVSSTKEKARIWEVNRNYDEIDSEDSDDFIAGNNDDQSEDYNEEDNLCLIADQLSLDDMPGDYDGSDEVEMELLNSMGQSILGGIFNLNQTKSSYQLRMQIPCRIGSEVQGTICERDLCGDEFKKQHIRCEITEQQRLQFTLSPENSVMTKSQCSSNSQGFSVCGGKENKGWSGELCGNFDWSTEQCSEFSISEKEASYSIRYSIVKKKDCNSRFIILDDYNCVLNRRMTPGISCNYTKTNPGSQPILQFNFILFAIVMIIIYTIQ